MAILKQYILMWTFLIAFLFGIISEKAVAFQHVVEGQVTNAETGESIPGVNIAVEGTTVGTVTNIDGEYELEVSGPESVLVFSYIGYISQSIDVDGQTTLNVELHEDLAALDEIVVIGYGTQTRATLTGSVASIGGAALVESPSVSLSNTFSGRIPGLVALNRSGEPGEDFSELLIRGRSTLGDTSPLIVIDGVAARGGLNQIDPNDIESVSVLKDASAAIYGAQAANGVILVTTKRGRVGSPTIRYSVNQGILRPTRLPEYADAATFAEFVNYQQALTGQDQMFTSEDIQKFRDGTDPVTHPDTDWQAETLADFSTQSKHNLSLGGGTEDIQYYVSGNYSNQDGIFRNGIHNANVIGGRINLDANITSTLSISTDLSVSEQNQKRPYHNTGQIVEFMYRNVPTIPAFYPNGLPGAGMSSGFNPVVMATDATGYRDRKTNLYQTSLSLNYRLPQVDGLEINGFVSYDKEHVDRKYWSTPWTVFQFSPGEDTYNEVFGGPANPQLTQRNDFMSFVNANVRLTYNFQTANHRINSFVATELTERRSYFLEAFRRDYQTTAVDQIFAGSEANMSTDGSESLFTRRNYFGRISYGFQDKYLLDINVRYDGSSIFPKENRYGFFPGVSVGWVLSEESFLQGANFLDELKLRGSWGQMGNDAIAPFQYLAAFNITQGSFFGTDRLLHQGVRQGVEPNPNITWEVANTANMGLDTELWDGLFGMTVDVFRTKRSNILAPSSASVPAYTGLTLPDENLGIVVNRGFEVGLTHRQIVGNLSYSWQGNVSFARNKIIHIDEAEGTPEWQRQEGKPMGSGLYYIPIGIFRSQGEIDNNPHPPGTRVNDLQYKDVDGDGQITALDRVRLPKTPTPEITFGSRFAMGYNNFDLSVLVQGQARAWRYHWVPQGMFGNVLLDHAQNRPGPDNPDSKYPNIYSDDADISAWTSEFWLLNAGFVRLKNLEVGYSLPVNLIDRLGMRNVRVYMNGINLLTFDKMGFVDPEGDEHRGRHYPQNKIFNFGIDISI